MLAATWSPRPIPPGHQLPGKRHRSPPRGRAARPSPARRHRSASPPGPRARSSPRPTRPAGPRPGTPRQSRGQLPSRRCRARATSSAPPSTPTVTPSPDHDHRFPSRRERRTTAIRGGVVRQGYKRATRYLRAGLATGSLLMGGLVTMMVVGVHAVGATVSVSGATKVSTLDTPDPDVVYSGSGTTYYAYATGT